QPDPWRAPGAALTPRLTCTAYAEGVISVALLGPGEVRRDGQLLAVPSGKPTEMLMRLAVSAGTVVPKEQLLEDLWAEGAVSTSANTVQSKVSRLRRALGDPDMIAGGSVGYRLAIAS